ncbi:MAG: hypothetical protein ACK57R_08645 [Dolichospermum sp.]|jgi:hypothetical protein|nr:hypothetical protein [Anabaena sp. 49628_E55]
MSTEQLQKSEVKFYEAFFEEVSYWAKDINTIIATAYEQSSKFGVGARVSPILSKRC